MRIFILEGDLNNSITGLRSNLVKKIREEGNEVIIIGGNPYKSKFGDTESVSDSDIIIQQLLFNTFNLIFLLKAIFKLIYLSFFYRPDQVLVFNIRPVIIWGFCNRFLNIKSAATITGTITYRKGKDVNKFYKIILDYCLRGFQNLIFQNSFDLEIFKLIGQNDYQIRTLIEGSGVDVDFFAAKDDIVKKWDFIFIGRLLKQKGIIEYLEASNKLLLKYPEIKFAFLGPFYSGSKNNSELKYSDIEIYLKDNKITYLGESKNIRNFLASSKSLVLPSYGEGLSNVLLEAGSMGLPLISTKVPGCMEVIVDGFNGFLCNSSDSLDLANKMEKFLNLPNNVKNEMSLNSREIVVSRFSKQFIVGQYLELLNLKKS
jgi:glycosyltransferase involved in cell wall biosynthesis